MWERRSVSLVVWPGRGKETKMDKNRIEGAGRQAAGAAKEAAGKATGNRQMQAEGAATKAAGKVQSTAGKVADKLKKQP
jgi:uncharacterized protein YjbJ (UPF0337 family)